MNLLNIIMYCESVTLWHLLWDDREYRKNKDDRFLWYSMLLGNILLAIAMFMTI